MSTKKLLLILGAVSIFSIISWLFFTYHYQKWPFIPDTAVDTPTKTVDYNKSTPDQIASGNTIKEQIAEQSKNDDDLNSPTSNNGVVAMDITAFNKTSDSLVVRTLIQKVTSSGECVLSMKGPGDKTYSDTVAVQAMASTSTCQGFNIPLSELVSGMWTVQIDFSDNSNTATVKKVVTI